MFSIFKKFKQHSINIKNYTAHPHDMVHIPEKFWENISMRFQVAVRKLNVTDGRMGVLLYLPSRASGTAGDKKITLKMRPPSTGSEGKLNIRLYSKSYVIIDSGMARYFTP